MAMGIYKRGQGYWTRMMSAIAAGVLVLMGAVWLWDTVGLVRIGNVQTIYIQAVASVIFVGVLFWIGYLLIGCKPKVVDFLIATEGEMKKVNWSTRREIMGSTWVVIGLTVVIAAIITVLDFLIYTPLFRLVRVLETPN